MQRSPQLQPQCPRMAGLGGTAPLCPHLLQPLHPWPCMATALPRCRDARVPHWAAGCPPPAGQTAVCGPRARLQGLAPGSSCPVIGTENTVSAPKCCKLCMLRGTESPLELSRLLRQLQVCKSSVLTMDTLPWCPALVSSWTLLVATARTACTACVGTTWEKP